MLCEPEIRVTSFSRSTDDFILLASDGLFDRFSSIECTNIARAKFLERELME